MIYRIAELTEHAYREMKRIDSLYGLRSPQSQEATARWFALDQLSVEFGIDTVEVLKQRPDSEIAKTMTVIDSVDYSEELDLEEYSPSAECMDYSPSNPWDAPGMSIKDFI